MKEAVAARPREETVTYTAAFRHEEGWWWAQVAEVPEAFGQGRTLEDARANVAVALEAALEWRADEGEEIPPSGQITVGPVTVPRPVR